MSFVFWIFSFNKMIFSTGAAVLLLIMTAEAWIGSSTEPGSFCTETKECLLYNVVCNGSGYEVRYYEASKAVSTDVESHFAEVALARALRKLYKYVTGENEAGIKIDLIAPLIIKVKDEYNVWNPSVYVVSFLLPSAYQTNAPRPTDSTVYLADLLDMQVYVKSYGGWMVSLTSRAQAYLFKAFLNSVQASYYNEYHYDAAYDSPMKLTNRHNEVWYVVRGSPVCV